MRSGMRDCISEGLGGTAYEEDHTDILRRRVRHDPESGEQKKEQHQEPASQDVLRSGF